jgi:hypothetical protein
MASCVTNVTRSLIKPELPSSDHLCVLSSGYRDAGDAAHTLIRTDGNYGGFVRFPCVFLYFRSIELALKAVLVPNGVSEHEIAKKLGHRISALLNHVQDFVPLPELGICSEDRQLLDDFSEDLLKQVV